MTNPFDAAIDTLRATMEGDWMMNDDYYVIPRVKSLEAAIRVLEAAGKVDKERFIEGIDEANQFGRLHRNVMSGYGLFIEDLEEIAAALPDKEKK